MKVKVIKRFKDKNTGKLYRAGDVIEVTKKRFAEIQKVGSLVEAVPNEEETADTSDKAE